MCKCELKENEYSILDISTTGGKALCLEKRKNRFSITDHRLNSFYINYCPICGRKLEEE